MIIDIHTHIFPDHIAKDAIPYLEEEGDVKAHLDGTKNGLIASMDKYNIDVSVVCSIATKPSQFEAILDWSGELKSERLIPFPSIHPDATDCLDQIQRIHQMGFKGIKMHPYYQDFFLDEERLKPLFALMSDLGLIVLMHTGFDIAFERIRRADPEKILGLHTLFPKLKLVTSHLGAWDQWQEVQAHLVGKPIFMDISFSLNSLDKHTARSIICNHPQEFILFGSDSPWEDQGETLRMLEELKLEESLTDKIKGKNAENLLLG